MTTNTVNPIPDGYHSLTPYLAVPDGPKAIEFYREVFGAEVVSRQDMPDGRVGQAELKFGNSMLQLSDQMPQIGLRAPNGASVVGPTSPGPTRRSPALATPITTRSPVGSPREHLVLAVEDLHVRNLIRSARGTVKHPRHPGSPEGGMTARFSTRGGPTSCAA